MKHLIKKFRANKSTVIVSDDGENFFEGFYLHESRCIDRLTLEIYRDLLREHRDDCHYTGFFVFNPNVPITLDEYRQLTTDILTINTILS